MLYFICNLLFALIISYLKSRFEKENERDRKSIIGITTQPRAGKKKMHTCLIPYRSFSSSPKHPDRFYDPSNILLNTHREAKEDQVKMDSQLHSMPRCRMRAHALPLYIPIYGVHRRCIFLKKALKLQTAN
jgi:hypothetical protein